jgi:hypothetical protein
MSGKTQHQVELLESVVDGLAHLLCGVDNRANTVYPKSSIIAYDGFELLDSRMSDDDDFILVGRDTNDMPVWPMDVRWGMTYQGGWLFKRVRTLDAKKWRGKLRVLTPRMCEIAETYIQPNAEAIGSVGAFGLVRGRVVDILAHNHPLAGERVHIGAIYNRGVRTDSGQFDSELVDISIAQGLSLRREYLWSVLLGEEGIPRARFVTDPIGVREAFRLRDIPPGKQRRAALRHWVSQHWRKRRDSGATDRAFVREYLRGATDFDWNGLKCTITPSREDQKKSTSPSGG